MKKSFLFIIASGVIFAAAGCKKHPELPRSRNDLVLRFFHSLKSNDANSAITQGRKLLAMEPSNTFIVQIIEVQECNQAVLTAQQKIDAGDINGALEILRECRRKYPENNTLPQLYAQINQLRHAKSLLLAMEHADTSEAMSSALTATRAGLSSNSTKALEQYFGNYEKRISRRREAEKRLIQQEEKILPKAAPATVK